MKTRPPESYVWLLPSVQVERVDEDAVVLSDEYSDLRFRRPDQRALIDFFLALDGSRRVEELWAVFSGARRILSRLENHGWLVRLARPLDVVVGYRGESSRQLAYFAQIQQRNPERALEELGTRSVLVVGLGGVGSYVALPLAGSGVGRLFLNDPDIIEHSNLNRQFLFTRGDLGRRKVEVAARALKARFAHLDVRTITRDVGQMATPKIPKVDAIVVCGECELLWDMPAVVGATPLVMGGYFGTRAVVGPCVAPRMGTACWSCLMRHCDRASVRRRLARRVTRGAAWNPSGATLNGIAGSLLAESALRLLAPSLGAPLLLNERMEIDTRTLRAHRTKIVARRLHDESCRCPP